jgi:ubiquinone/menaquinone biosynthesis C-methylase UbiE
MGVLHHIPDPEKGFREIQRVLKPGGKFIVMLYHRNSAYYHILLNLRSLLSLKSKQQVVNEFDGIGNPKGLVYNRKELKNILEKK